jgi:hypothetical protein
MNYQIVTGSTGTSISISLRYMVMHHRRLQLQDLSINTLIILQGY